MHIMRIFMMAFAVLACMLLSCPSGQAASDSNERATQMAEITGVRINADANHVRIVVDATKEVDYKTTVLQNPGRVVVDLSGAWLGASVKKSQSIGGRFASRVRIAQHNEDTVRVVVETEMGSNRNNYHVFSLAEGAVPYRIVMDFGNLRGSSDSSVIDFGGQRDPAPKEDRAEQPKPTQPQGESKEDAQKARAGNSSDDAREKDAQEKEQKKRDKDRESKASKEEPKEQDSTSTPPEDEKSDQQTSSIQGDLPILSGKRIAIDAGHGGNDSGAIGPTGVTEKSITLRVAQRVQQMLEANGATVFMTRTEDTEVSPKHAKASDVEELQARCDVANNNDVEIFVSIHMDSFSNRSVKGTTGYYFAGSAKSQRLADNIRVNLIKELGTDSRGTKSCHFYVVRHTDMPATLVELAFISNPAEEKLMNKEEGIQKAAQGIVNGIAAYFGT